MCTAASVNGLHWSLLSNKTPDVPKDTKPSPSLMAPTPQAAAALSPAPPTILTSLGKPNSEVRSARICPAT